MKLPAEFFGSLGQPPFGRWVRVCEAASSDRMHCLGLRGASFWPQRAK